MGFQSPKIQLGMGKTKVRISPNHENMWDLGRDWEMEKIIMGKGNGKIVETLILRERERKNQPFLVKANFSRIW